MAIVYSYPGATPTLSDALLGTQFDSDGNPTKSFQISDIVDLIYPYQLPYKSYTALLNIQGGLVTLISELENSISETVTFTYDGSSQIGIVFSSQNIVQNKLIGFCYSGGDAEDSIQNWLVSFIGDNEVRLTDPEPAQPAYLLIRVEIRLYN